MKTIIILIFTKIRLHFATVCASGPFFTVYLIYENLGHDSLACE